jgi:hypothetical protein
MRNAVKATQTDTVGINTRVGVLDWTRVSTHLDDHGWAMIEKLLTADECETIAGLYDDDGRFRSHVVMARHGFGRGEYKYFTYPLPGMPISSRAATRRGRRGRRHSCCSTPRATTTLSTRISTASMSFRCR